MEKQGRLKTVLGIGLLYVMVTSIFSLINKLCSFVLSQNAAGVKIRYFLQDSFLWAAVVAAILVVLILSLKRLDPGAFHPFRDPLIRVTAGTLILLDGIIDLAGTVPVYVTSIRSAIQSSQMIQQNVQGMLHEMIVSDAAAVLLILCQIVAGICLIRSRKDETA